MQLNLSPEDRRLLSTALTVLSSPLESASIEIWQEELLKALKPLFGADAGAFVLGYRAGSSAALVDLPERYLEQYMELQAQDGSAGYWGKGAQAFTTESLSGGDRRAYTNDPMYSLFYEPHRVRDAAGIILARAERAPVLERGRIFAPGGVAIEGVLSLYADQPGRRLFGSEGLALMELLLPMVQSAAQVWNELGIRREDLSRIVDSLSEGIAIFDPSSGATHRNPTLLRLLAEDPDAGPLEMAMMKMVETLTRSLLLSGSLKSAGPASIQQVETRENRYTIRATFAGSVLGLQGAVLVQLEPRTRRVPSEDQLRQRYGLTPAEARVARQIAEGARTESIAEALHISIHTARRHTEHIRGKLGARSRAEITSVILRGAPAGAEAEIRRGIAGAIRGVRS